ncbi:hypothetical protein JD844_019734 [Phrynosoma platyrhinos]|uniref:LTD domain-containing protein n=1 Tax=Phrynosoma platyrhinos TaxID=52577 RepID=A0ABQ7TR78_PHRPL|nr:hypothetical protein JD844_019734 [Phrynosoma platyrhinos]
MGPSLLIVSLFVCIWLYEVDSQNHIKIPKEQRMAHSLLINEVNADSPGEDTLEYLELYHTTGRRAPLDGYSLVLYNGNGNVAYNVRDLRGLFTDDQGFLLMGSAAVVPKPQVILPKNTIQNGPDAIALYFGRTDLSVGMKVTGEGLVDAVVHKSKENDRADELVTVLTPGVEPFLEDPLFRTTDESLERCQGVGSQWFFQVGVPTPGLDNHCIPFSQLNASFLLINEVSIGDFEFIELQGPPSTVVKDVVLTLIDGKSQEIYLIMEVHGKTSPDGLLLLDPNHPEIPVDLMFPQNSTSRLLRTTDVIAVALYRGASRSFAIGGTALATNLLDAFIYTDGNASSKLQDILTSGKSAFYVRERSLQNYTSMSRCVCCSVTRDPSAYAVSQPTPHQFNDCPKKRFGQKISLCLQVSGESEFGAKDCQQGSPEKSEILMYLAEVVHEKCNCNIHPNSSKDSTVECQGTELIFSALLTARSAAQLDSLNQAFSDVIEEMSFGKWNFMGVNACLSQANVTNMPPEVMPTDPRTTREPPSPLTLLINEVNPDNPGSREDTEYIELFYPGPAPFELWNYWLVLYNGKNNLAYQVVKLGGYRTDQRGYFLVGSAGVTPQPSIILPDNTIQNGAEAVALYHSPKAIYKINMPVTAEGLVDAVVYKSRGSDKADKLLAVTEITPFQENACLSLDLNSTEEILHSHSIIINELGMDNNSILYQFVELKGKPGASLKGYTLKFFSGHNTQPYSSIPLQGTFGDNGLDPSSQQHSHRVALVRHIQAPNDTLVPDEIVEDMVAFTREPHTSQLNSSFPIYFFPRKEESYSMVLKQRLHVVDKWVDRLYYSLGLADDCSMWPQNALILTRLQQTLVRSMEESCHCGVSLCYIQGLNFTCFHSILKLSGQVWATSPEQLQMLVQWQSSLSTSPHPFPMERRLLKGNATCSSPSGTALWSEGELIGTQLEYLTGCMWKGMNSSLQAWEIALTVLGSILLALLLAGVAFYWIKRRPQNYTTIEMNDHCEIMAEI